MDGLTFVRTVETLLSIRGIQKTEFYRESGISDATISQYRSGHAKSASSATIRKAANFFKMEPVQFESALENLDSGKELGQKENPLSPETEGVMKDILIKFLSMPEEKQKKLLDMLNTLA